MKNASKVIQMLSGESRPKYAPAAAYVLGVLHNTGDLPAHSGAVMNVIETLCEWQRGKLQPGDTLLCISALGHGLPESMDEIIDSGPRCHGRMDWNEFVLGCFEALAFHESNEGSLREESHKPFKARIEKSLANLLIERREKEGPMLSDRESGNLSNLMPAFVNGYDCLNVLRLLKGRVDWNRYQGDPRTTAPLQIIDELCRKYFGAQTLEEKVATLTKIDRRRL
jgi:hypothetical protein